MSISIYAKLAGLIAEKYGSRSAFCAATGFSNKKLSLSMSGKREWTPRDIIKMCTALDIADEDIGSYFIAPARKAADV